MSSGTSIEWTRGDDGSPGATWNPVTGCTKVSPGCDNCYAETFAERWRGVPGHHFENGFDVQLRPDKLMLPLRWRKPRRIFVNSMSDLFHADIPDEYIAKVFAVMAATPRHTYQVLTKRHGRMRALLNSEEFHCGFEREFLDLTVNHRPELAQETWSWPLPNVHLGVSVENQKWANVRIPALTQTPAAVRFLSCEPLLGPVDITQWMLPISPMTAEQAPSTWAEWTWSDWVPARVREEIERFWGAGQGRSPRHWISDMHQQGAPPFGVTLEMGDGFSSNPPRVTGRYVHCWGNIGRLVLGDDPNREYAYTSFGTRDRARARGIDWVITGGESGPGARPAHPDWFRSLRDQCAAAEVSYLHKQNGEWAERSTVPSEDWVSAWDEKRVTYVHPEDGRRQSHGEWGMSDHLEGWACVQRVGKKAAGRELDGRTWDQFPKAVA